MSAIKTHCRACSIDAQYNIIINCTTIISLFLGMYACMCIYTKTLRTYVCMFVHMYVCAIYYICTCLICSLNPVSIELRDFLYNPDGHREAVSFTKLIVF